MSEEFRKLVTDSQKFDYIVSNLPIFYQNYKTFLQSFTKDFYRLKSIDHLVFVFFGGFVKLFVPIFLDCLQTLNDDDNKIKLLSLIHDNNNQKQCFFDPSMVVVYLWHLRSLKGKRIFLRRFMDICSDLNQLHQIQHQINSIKLCFGDETAWIVDKLFDHFFPSPKSNEQIDSPSQSDATCCKVCMENEMKVLFLPCRHLSTCISCSKKVDDCTICRTIIQQRITCFI